MKKSNYDFIRADQITKSGLITDQIINLLFDADLVIADLFGHNPNVFYELAIRHAVKKPFIQLYEPEKALPFDIAGIRSIPFNIEDIRSVNRCKEKLKAFVKEIEENPNDITTPISRSIDRKALESSGDLVGKGLSEVIEQIQEIKNIIINFRGEQKPMQVSTITPTLYSTGTDLLSDYPTKFNVNKDGRLELTFNTIPPLFSDEEE